MKKQIAIKVENEREFNALMKHYESKGWQWCTKEMPTHVAFGEISHRNGLIEYKDAFSHNLPDKGHGYTILDFPTFAQIAGIELPPNEVVINTTQVQYRVTKDSVDCMLFGGHRFKLELDTIREIYTALNSLQ